MSYNQGYLQALTDLDARLTYAMRSYTVTDPSSYSYVINDMICFIRQRHSDFIDTAYKVKDNEKVSKFKEDL